MLSLHMFSLFIPVYEIVNPSFGYFRMQVGRRGKREVLGGDAWILCRMSLR